MQERKKGSQIYPRTGEVINEKARHWCSVWLLPITGFLALIWFLFGVIPKPSRVTYPCQQVAFPLASGFVAWLLGLAGSVVFIRKARRRLHQSRYFAAIVCMVITVLAIWAPLCLTDRKPILAENPRPPQAVNAPVGTAMGIHPGRVVWVHDPDATDWNGSGYGHWFENNHIDLTVVKNMVSQAVRELAGETSDDLAWDAIFRHFNESRQKGPVSYEQGEKIAVKVNFTLTYSSDPVLMDKPSQYIDCIDNSPQLTIALLEQLINVVGINPTDITVGDPTRIMPNYWYDMVHGYPGLGNVVYMARAGGKGRTAAHYSNVPFYWSDANEAHWEGVTEQDYIPISFSQADYIINFAILKSHSQSGVTLCGKNLYGSLIRNPNETVEWYNMHHSRILANESPGTGYYRAIVDLMGHRELGAKTVLYLVDGLFAGEWWTAEPVKWNMEPFNGDWPSSIFLSQDGVAIDSVCFDFLLAEWPKNGEGPENQVGANSDGSDDYLHEAALADSPSSGTFYDPENDGTVLSSLGVHEHWNNPQDKQYSRNLGTGNGIELISITPGTETVNTGADGGGRCFISSAGELPE